MASRLLKLARQEGTMRSFVLACLAFVPSVAFANPSTTVAVVDPAAPPASSAIAPAPPPPPTPEPGPHQRNGFSISLGEEVGSGPSSGFTGQLYGVDWRIGAKLAGPYSVYADTH